MESKDSQTTNSPAPPATKVDSASASLASKQTYWSHDPYAAPESDNARLADISKTFIGLFYHSLLEKHCRVATAVEVESSLTRNDNRTKANPGDAIDYINQQLRQAGAKTQKRNGIYRAYKDKSNVYDEGDLEITTWPRKPIETVAYVKAIKKILVESTSEFKEMAPQYIPSSSATLVGQHAKSLKLRFGNIESPDSDPLLFGEHINISLHHTDSDENSRDFDLAKNNMMEGPMAKLLSKTLLRHTRADSLLLLSQPASVERMQRRYENTNLEKYKLHNSRSMCPDTGGKMKPLESSRLEWVVPDSASDIHLTMLTAMASTYALAQAVNQTLGTETLPADIPAQAKQPILNMLKTMVPAPATRARTQQERVEQFHEHSLVLKMMHAVAAEAHDPAKQQQYNALITEFEATAIRQSNQQFAQTGKQQADLQR